VTEERVLRSKKRDDATEFGGLRVVWLEAFVLSSRTQSRVEVAAQMGIDPATVTKHIKKLELWLASGRSYPLLEDNIWPTHLTDAGKAFLPQAEKVLNLLRQARITPMEISQAEPSKPKASTAPMKIPPIVLKPPKT